MSGTVWSMAGTERPMADRLAHDRDGTAHGGDRIWNILSARFIWRDVFLMVRAAAPLSSVRPNTPLV